MKKENTNDDTFLAKWLDNTLSEDALSDFKKSQDYALYQKIADKSSILKAPSFNQDKVFRKIEKRLKERKTKVRSLIPLWAYSTAAAMLLLLGLTFFLNQQSKLSSNSGQQLAFVLPDGSDVQLNGKSFVTFDESKWEKGNRRLKLEGEAYFKVKKGSTFSVVTQEGVVTVLGTQFNIQTVKDYLSVECYEGKVNVKNKKFESVLTPGKGVHFFKNKHKNYNIVALEPNWLHHKYDYNGVPLEVVFKDLENVYHVKIVNKNVDLTATYTGTLINDNLEKALKVISMSMNISYKIIDTEIFISN